MWTHSKDGTTRHHLYCVFTYIYSLLTEKDICDYQNISVKLLYVYVCSSSEDLFIFLFYIFCVIYTFSFHLVSIWLIRDYTIMKLLDCINIHKGYFENLKKDKNCMSKDTIYMKCNNNDQNFHKIIMRSNLYWKNRWNYILRT